MRELVRLNAALPCAMFVSRDAVLASLNRDAVSRGALVERWRGDAMRTARLHEDVVVDGAQMRRQCKLRSTLACNAPERLRVCVVSDEKTLLLFATHKQPRPRGSPNFNCSTPCDRTRTSAQTTMTGVNPAIFQDLQARVDEDTAVRDVSCGPRQGT